jgi:hypothetical protein
VLAIIKTQFVKLLENAILREMPNRLETHTDWWTAGLIHVTRIVPRDRSEPANLWPREGVRRLGGNYTKVGKQGREVGEHFLSQFLGRFVCSDHLRFLPPAFAQFYHNLDLTVRVLPQHEPLRFWL